jgi:hypothetical protein
MEDDPVRARTSHSVTTESSGREIKVYDDSRRPREWYKLLSPSQCAVFFKRVNSEIPLSPRGVPVARFRDCTFLMFDKLDDARRFSEARVEEVPEMCCEIFDSQGKAAPPLLVVVHPSVAARDELSASSVRNRMIAAALLFFGSLPLIWWDWHSGSGLILPTVLGMNMIFAALRLLQWKSARSQRLVDQGKRLHAHAALEEQSRNEPGNDSSGEHLS